MQIRGKVLMKGAKKQTWKIFQDNAHKEKNTNNEGAIETYGGTCGENELIERVTLLFAITEP